MRTLSGFSAPYAVGTLRGGRTSRTSVRFAGPLLWALVLMILVLAPALRPGMAQASGEVRRPRGVYAFGFGPDYPPLFASLLANPAVSGLAIGVGWGALNPNPPSGSQAHDWSYLQEAFDQVAAWNAANPSQAPKTIMVSLDAGFSTPKWVKDQIPSCDGLFDASLPPAASNCGKATFSGYFEGGGVLPMPWNAVYKSAFRTFLQAFAKQYASNPVLVSIDIAGPTAASTEMILPNIVNTPPQAQFGGFPAGKMWRKLLAHAYPSQPAYQDSDQAFIDEWDAAIDMFGEIFHGLTLTTWTGDGLLNLSDKGFTVPSAFTDDCPNPTMDCAAETTILSYLAEPSVASADVKATGEAGLNGRRSSHSGNLGPRAAKLLSQSTAQLASPAAQILAGEQFGQPASVIPVQQGCAAPWPPRKQSLPAGCEIPSTCSKADCIPIACIPQVCLAVGVTPTDLAEAHYKTFGDVPKKDLIPPEQAAYNILRNYFGETPVASFFGGTPGSAPENYLQIYFQDFQYAAKHLKESARVVQTDGTITSVNMQVLLNLASQKLLSIAERPPQIISVALDRTPYIGPNSAVTISGTDLAPVGFDAVDTTDPTSLRGVSVTVNGEAASVYSTSPTQVLIHTPPDPLSGLVPVRLTTNGLTSAVFMVQAKRPSGLPGNF